MHASNIIMFFYERLRNKYISMMSPSVPMLPDCLCPTLNQFIFGSRWVERIFDTDWLDCEQISW